MTAGSGLAGGRGHLASMCVGKGEGTMEVFVPSRVGAKHIAGMKDLPGGLSQAGRGGKQNAWAGSQVAASTCIRCSHGARPLPGPLQD